MRRIIREESKARVHWRDLQLEPLHTYPTRPPAKPRVGERWYNPDTHCLCIWDGIEWEAVPLD